MSHHATHAEVSTEPNLVPLLDLVLQLILFFMMCANFVMEENDQTIQLPLSQMAKPIPETGPDVVHLSIDDEGRVRVVGRKTMTQDDEVVAYLRDVSDAARLAMSDRNETGDLKTLVIIRASRECSFARIYQVMRRCQEAGLRKLQLRAERG
jgi:biopolymer transport protein ExbD